MALRWRLEETPSEFGMRVRKLLIVCYSDGSINQYAFPPGVVINTIKPTPKNNLYTLDYAADGLSFASAGKDFKIRVYDEATFKLKTTMHSAGFTAPGHSNRVFSVKFHPDD